MFSIKQKYSPSNCLLHRVPALPGISEFYQYSEQALANKGKTVIITWQSSIARGTRFELSVICNSALVWRLMAGTGNKLNLVLEHITDDVLLMYNVIVSACGEWQKIIEADGAMKTSETYGDTNQGALYVHGTELDKRDSHKGDVDCRDTSWLRATAPDSGDLHHQPVRLTLKSLCAALSTGRFTVHDGPCSGTSVYFMTGVIVHAENAFTQGPIAIYALLEATNGHYTFERNVSTFELTINECIDELIADVERFNEGLSMLQRAGWKTTSIIVKRAYKALSHEEIDGCLGLGSNSLEYHHRFYQAIDDRSSAVDLARRLQLTKVQCVQIMQQLLTSNLITFLDYPVSLSPVESCDATEPLQTVETLDMAPPAPTLTVSQIESKLSPMAVDSLCRLMKSTATGIFTYPALLFFMEQEVQRVRRLGGTFSLLVIRAVYNPMGCAGRSELPAAASRVLIDRINKLKRGIDVLAHFEGSTEFALLLPSTACAGALILAQRVVSALMDQPLCPGVDAGNLEISFGIASSPDDGDTPDSLSCAASAFAARERVNVVPQPQMFAGLPS